MIGNVEIICRKECFVEIKMVFLRLLCEKNLRYCVERGGNENVSTLH
jgi:hypothetical protein